MISLWFGRARACRFVVHLQEAAVTVHLCAHPLQHNMARCHIHSVITAETQSAKMPPNTHTHTHSLNPVVKLQLKIESGGSDGAVISLKIHSCKILLFKPPSPLFNSLIHLSPDCNAKQASSAASSVSLCACARTSGRLCVVLSSSPIRGMSLACPTLAAPAEPSVKHLRRALPCCSSQSGTLAVNDIS